MVTGVESAANEAIRSVATKHGIGITEVDGRIPPTAEYLAAYGHFTDEGAAVARILAYGLIARGRGFGGRVGVTAPQ